MDVGGFGIQSSLVPSCPGLLSIISRQLIYYQFFRTLRVFHPRTSPDGHVNRLLQNDVVIVDR